MSLSAYALLGGVLLVEVSGAGCESFLNATVGQNIEIWSIRREGSGCVLFKIRACRFLSLHRAVRASHVRIHIVKRYGPLCGRGRIVARPGLLIGAVLAAACIYASSLYIWSIEVIGCNNVSAAEVVAGLADNGLCIGTRKSGFEASETENMFLRFNDRFSWISVNIKGTTAYVEVRESSEKPSLSKTDEPCSIYASRDGVIASVDDYMGYAAVSPGDTVTAGQLLVSGAYTDKYGVEYKLHSLARVTAYTTHSFSVTVPFRQTEHVKTGKIKNKYSLRVTRFNIPLYFSNKIMYNSYDITESEKQLRLTDSFALPVSLCKTAYTEVIKTECVKSREAALNDAYERLYGYEHRLTVTVLGRSYEESFDTEGVTVKVLLDCYEDIGIQGKIN